MLSARALHKHFHYLIRLVVAAGESNGIRIQFYHKSEVYGLTLYKTGERVKPDYRRRRSKPRKGAVQVDTDVCLMCQSMVVTGICINKKCDTNTQPKLNS